MCVCLLVCLFVLFCFSLVFFFFDNDNPLTKYFCCLPVTVKLVEPVSVHGSVTTTVHHQVPASSSLTFSMISVVLSAAKSYPFLYFGPVLNPRKNMMTTPASASVFPLDHLTEDTVPSYENSHLSFPRVSRCRKTSWSVVTREAVKSDNRNWTG